MYRFIIYFYFFDKTKLELEYRMKNVSQEKKSDHDISIITVGQQEEERMSNLHWSKSANDGVKGSYK